jgi:hypothetical protein
MGLFSHRAATKRIITLDKIQSPLREMRPASCISDDKDQKERLSTVLVGMGTVYLGPR